MKRIYNVEEITLIGWEDEEGNPKPIRIYPLVIKKFRKLAEMLDAAKTPEDGKEEKKFIDVIVDAVAFCMQTYEPKLSDPEVLTDYIDMKTLEYILDVASGIKLSDPNLKAAMETSGKSL